MTSCNLAQMLALTRSRTKERTTECHRTLLFLQKSVCGPKVPFLPLPPKRPFRPFLGLFAFSRTDQLHCQRTDEKADVDGMSV